MRRFLPFILIVAILSAIFLPVAFDSNIHKQNVLAFIPSGVNGNTTQPGVIGIEQPDGTYNSYTLDETDQINEDLENSQKMTDDNLPACDFLGLGDSKGSFYGCVIQGFYYALWMPTSWLAGLAAKFLDYFIFYSIQSTSYSKSTFVYEGWKIVRDIANISFIFVLIYLALRTILNLAGAETKKAIAMVIVMALLINFSLFFTRVVVDGGNILAAVMYNNVTASTVKDEKVVSLDKGKIGEEQISVALVNNFDPQKIIDNSNLAAKYNMELRTPFLAIIILSTIINIVMIYVFLAVAFLFVARVLGLMIAMIFSPFAFASLAIPGGSGFLRDWGWDKWFSNLIKMTLLAPVFIFFLYLILKFSATGILKGIGESLVQEGNSFGNFMVVVLPFALIMGLLLKAKDLASELSGEIGEKINKFAGAATGLAIGAATGGAALLGRATIGAAAAGRLEGAAGERIRERASQGDWFAKQQLKTFEGLSKTSFDARKSALGRTVEKKTGIDLSTPGFRVPLTNVDLNTEGGYRGKIERAKKEEAEFATKLKMPEIEAKTQDSKAKSWKDEYEKQRDIAEEQTMAAGAVFNELDFKKMYEGGQIVLQNKDANGVVTNRVDAQGNNVMSTDSVATSAEVNSKRMSDRADTMQYGKGFVEERDRKQAEYKERLGQATMNSTTPPPKFDEEALKTQYLERRPDYVQSRDEARARLGGAFNEKMWRQEEYFTKAMSREEQEIINDLRKQAGEENKKEKPLSNKERKILTARLDQANIKMNDMINVLRQIANQNPGTGGNINNVTQVMIDNTRTALIDQQHIKEVEIKRHEQTVRSHPAGSPQRRQAENDLLRSKRDKQQIMDQINGLKNILENRTRTEEDINNLSQKIE